MKPRLLLVDGHSVAYRSFFAFIRSPLRDSRGRNTSAVFGFANTLRKLLEELKPTHCAVAFDTAGPTFRHEQYREYKAQRPSAPDELVEQIPLVKRLVAAWGITACEFPGVEADDVLGTLVKRAVFEGYEVVLASSDKDLLQLVSPGVVVYDPWSGVRYEPEQVREKLGVGPELVVDYLALTGDATDNVPGVAGIGPKRARALLERYGTLDRALAQEPKLADARAEAELSRDLVRIDTGVPLELAVGELRLGARNDAALRELFEELDFRSLAREMSPARTEVEPVPLDQSRVEASDVVSISRDDNGLWEVAIEPGRAMTVPEEAKEWFAGLLATPGRLKVGCGLKAVMHEQEIAAPLRDVGIMAWLVDPNRREYGLSAVVAQVLGRALPGRTPGRSEAVLEAHAALELEIEANGLRAVLEELEMPLVPVLTRMEQSGVRIDTDHFRLLEAEFKQELDVLEREIRELAGIEFNVASPRQLGTVLFERLGLARGRKTKTGYSTDSAVLTGLADAHPVVPKVLRWRELAKLRGTYLSPLLDCADRDGRVHTTFNQCGAATGRLSSSNPNLQNIPIRGKLGQRIRAGFIADEGMVLISADYSQIELRVLAHISGDEKLLHAFAAGEDVHIQTAAAVFGLKPEEVTPEHRRMAKVVNYGLIYGMGDYGLSSRMGLSLEEARAFLDEYMASFSGVAAWREQVTTEALEKGRMRSLSGRIRPVPAVTNSNRNIAEAARRAAINAPVQGSAADIIKRAMLRVDERIHRERIAPGMVLQIHDELLLEIPQPEADRVREFVREEMESAWKLDLPLVAEVGSGRNWADAHGGEV